MREVKEGIPASVIARSSRYMQLPLIDRLMTLFRDVGFTGVQRLDGIFHHPVVLGLFGVVVEPHSLAVAGDVMTSDEQCYAEGSIPCRLSSA